MMNAKIDGKTVSLVLVGSKPILAADGKPLTDAGGAAIMGETSYTMTLEQYEKHARDPAFVSVVPTDKHAAAMSARGAELELELALAQVLEAGLEAAPEK